LNRGARLVELLKQPQYQPLPVEQQVASLYAGTNGYFDDVPVADVRRAEEELHRFLATRFGSLLGTIKTKKTIDDEIKGQLNAALKEFTQTFAPTGARA
jgi:F-type H+-transporting ATPase subunit alpha